MNRRTLLQSLASVAVIPFAIDGIDAKAIPLEKGKKYLILVEAGQACDLRTMCKSLGALGIQGTVHIVNDTESAMRIYEVA